MPNEEERIQLEIDELRNDVDKLYSTVYGESPDKGLKTMVQEHEGALVMVANQLSAVRVDLVNQMSILRKDTRYAIIVLATLLLLILIGNGVSTFILFEHLVRSIASMG